MMAHRITTTLHYLLVWVIPLAWAASTFAQTGSSTQQDDIPPLPTDPATVVAVVGQTPVLWGDIQPKVENRINTVLKKSGQTLPESELDKARLMLTRNLLIQTIQSKMMREAFLLEQVGTQSAEKRNEVNELMSSKARQMFFDNEIKALQKKHKTEDLTELDAILRKNGSSLIARQREFSDMMLGHLFMREKVNRDPSVTIAEINARYERDLDTYRHAPRARWEQLSVLFANHPSRDEAMRKINEMGRDAYFGGNLQAVAREKSEEAFAGDGGVHDWTSKGSLASKPIDQSIFSIPLNEMSEIIEDDQGLHIVRVLERKPAGVQPLHELQDKIREQIKKEKVSSAQSEMLADLRERIPVWSMYPNDLPGAKPIRPVAVASRSESTLTR